MRRLRHRDRGAAQHEIGGADQQDGDAALHHRGEEGEQHAALQLGLVGDHVGGDHRLAVAGTGGVEDAIGEGEPDQRPELPGVFAHAFERLGQRAVEALLLHVHPGEETAEDASRLEGRLGRADAERRLGVGHGGAATVSISAGASQARRCLRAISI